MKRNVKLLLKIIIPISCLFLYCEWIIYYQILSNCEWPQLDPKNVELNISIHNEKPLNVMVLSDIHLLGSKNGYWFDKTLRGWQMHRAFQTAVRLHEPELIFILGDLTDEGQWATDEEFQEFVERFYNIFAVRNDTRMQLLVGNHDIGFPDEITPHLVERFEQGFGSTKVKLFTIRGIHFVVLNSMVLEDENSRLCLEAEAELKKIEETLKCSQVTESEKCKSTAKLDTYSRPILMQHYPLYRISDEHCKEPDEAPLPVKLEKCIIGMDVLTKRVSDKLLDRINPRLVMAGHTHHGCTTRLSNGGGIEITVPSFNWRNKNNPSYNLVVLTPNNYAIHKCMLPKQSTVITIYVIGFLLLLVWLKYSAYYKVGNNRYRGL